MAKVFDKRFHKKFGQRVRQLRLEKGLTQEQLSLEIGAANSYIGIVENAQRDTTLSKIQKIAKALDVLPSELLKFD